MDQRVGLVGGQPSGDCVEIAVSRVGDHVVHDVTIDTAIGLLALDEVEPVGLASPRAGDVGTRGRRCVVEQSPRDVERAALHPVVGDGVAVLDVCSFPRRRASPPVGQPHPVQRITMACEVNDNITRCLVDLHDDAAAAVLHIPSRVVGVAEASVVAPCDDRIAGLERLAVEVDRRSTERARRDETRARPFGQVPPRVVARGDHRVPHARLPVDEPVVDHPVVQLVGGGRARDAPGSVPAGE